MPLGLGQSGRCAVSWWDARVGVDACDEILPEFQEGSMRRGKNAAENILHFLWSLNLDLRPKTSCTTYGTLTLS